MQKLLVFLLLTSALPCSAQSFTADTTGRLLGLPLINQIFPSRLSPPDTSNWPPLQRSLLRVGSKNTGGCLSAISLGLLDSTGDHYLYQRLEELATALYQAGTPLLMLRGMNAGSRAIHLNKQGNPYGITYYGGSSCLITEAETEAVSVFNHVTYTLTGYQPENLVKQGQGY